MQTFRAQANKSLRSCDDTHKSRCVTVSCGMDMRDKCHGLQVQIAQENKAVAVLPFSLQVHNSNLPSNEGKDFIFRHQIFSEA